MKVTREEINAMAITTNKVLVKPVGINNKIKQGNVDEALEVYFDTSYNPEKHAPVYCEVIKCCKRIVATTFLPWEGPVELKPGDHVIVEYMEITDKLGEYDKNPELFFVDDEMYFMVSYQSIFTKVKDGVAEPINGYNIVVPLAAYYGDMGIYLPTKESENQFLVLKTGLPVKYKHKGSSDEIVDLNKGDIILCEAHCNIPIEHDLHRSTSFKVYAIQRRHVLAKLKQVLKEQAPKNPFSMN